MKLSSIMLLTAISFYLTSCKEQKMVNTSSLIPAPVVISFYTDEIDHIFPVIQERSIGFVYGAETLVVAKINKDELEIDEFPNSNDFDGYTAEPLLSDNPDTMVVKFNKFLYMVDWRNKKVLNFFKDNSKSIESYYENSKEIDHKKRLILSLWDYYPMENHGGPNYFFVIDDLLNQKRLKEIPISEPYSEFPVFFTPNYIIYRNNYENPWVVLDNNLEKTKHPLVDLITENEKDSVFFAFNKGVFISEPDSHAMIISYNHVLQKDMLFLATWHGKPKVQPIIIDSTVLGTRRLVNFMQNNTMSPSGHWVYFCAQADRIEPDAHFLIYLDPALPNGYLPPVRLGLEGTVKCAGWMTNPEGLILYQGFDLYYYDLSKFNPGRAE